VATDGYLYLREHPEIAERGSASRRSISALLAARKKDF